MSATTPSSRDEYEAWHARLAVDAEANAPWHRLIKKHLNPSRHLGGRAVLEIGCGRGGFACWLAAQPLAPDRLVAADFAATAVQMAREYAQKHGLTAITWDVADIQSLPYEDAAFDTVISCETVEHVPDPARAVRELARVLKPSGQLLLTTPNYFGTMGLYRGYLRLRGRRYTEEGQPINNFNMLPRTRRWVRAAGLRVVATDAIGHYLPFPGRPPMEYSFWDRFRFVTRWLALHSLVIGEKPRA
ncbi:MAG: class I SAM-dependent methyltransferase [Gemmataceae bacterium]